MTARALYWNWNPKTNRWAVRSGRWKIVKYGLGAPTAANQWQLYDLKQDPKEQSDLAANHPQVLIELHKEFLTHRGKDAVKNKLDKIEK